MKRHILYLCTIGISLFLNACISEIERNVSISTDGEAEITVSEAREFFEQEMLTRNDDTPSPNVLSPGDFTPRWDDAKISQNCRIACVDVPIIPTYRYRAIRSEFQLGQAKAYVVDVSQKVVVVKDRETGVTASYVMSLIPDKDFAAKHKGDISDLFLNANGREKFSGILLYTHHGCPIRFSKYIDGNIVESTGTCGISDKQQYKDRLHKIYQDLSRIKFKKIKNIFSRSGEDYGDESDSNGDFDSSFGDDPNEGFGTGFGTDPDDEFGLVDPNTPEPEPGLPPDPNEHPYPYPDPQPDPDPNPNESLESPDPSEDGGGGPQDDISRSFFISIGKNGFEKTRVDILVNKNMQFKKLKLRQGEYTLEDLWLNDTSKDAIHKRYKSVYYEYRDHNAEKFGDDIYPLLRENGNYNHSWIESRTQAIIVCCDESLTIEDLKDSIASYKLRNTTAIAREAIEIKNIEGINQFTIGLMKKQ